MSSDPKTWPFPVCGSCLHFRPVKGARRGGYGGPAGYCTVHRERVSLYGSCAVYERDEDKSGPCDTDKGNEAVPRPWR